MPYNHSVEDLEQLDFQEKNAVLNYFINPDTPYKSLLLFHQKNC